MPAKSIIIIGSQANGNADAKIKRLLAAGAFPKSNGELDIIHDDWCEFMINKRACNCDPWIKLNGERIDNLGAN